MGAPRAVNATLALMATAALAAPAVAQEQVIVRHAAPAWLGLTYQTQWVEADGSCAPRVVVEAVVQGSPAERAGLRTGDAILLLNGEPVPPGGLVPMAEHLSPGDSVRLRILREGASRELAAVADRRPDRPVRIYVERSGGVDEGILPVVELLGDTLVARNVGARLNPGGPSSYWVLQEGDEPEYRTVNRWSRSELDERVAALLRCVAESRSAEATWSVTRGPVHVDLEALQARGDSLRVLFAERALQRQRTQGLFRGADSSGSEVSRIRIVSPEGDFRFQVEEHVALGLRAVAGAELTALEPELAEYFRNADTGLLVLRVGTGTPSEAAGLRPGDVVVAANGRRVGSVADLRQIIALPAADPVALTVVRQGRTRTLELGRN